jgi:hypothetical protein
MCRFHPAAKGGQSVYQPSKRQDETASALLLQSKGVSRLQMSLVGNRRREKRDFNATA